MKALGPSPLLGAIAASALVHASLLAVPTLDLSKPATRLYASLDTRLVVEMTPAAPASGVAVPGPAAATPSRMIETRDEAPVTRPPEAVGIARVQPAVPDLARPVSAAAAPARQAAPTEMPGDVRVRGEEVVALSRLGDLLERQLRDYPREVQAPVRIYRPLEAIYPAEARAQGVEGDVLAWVVVGPTAEVEEVQIVEGDPVFHEAVTEAIRNGIYQPAFDAGEGLHYPIALEFRFTLAGGPGRETEAAVAAVASPAR